MWSQKLFWKSFFYLTLIILFSTAVFGGFLYFKIKESNFESLKSNLRKETEVLADIIQSSPDLISHPEKVARAVHLEDRATIMTPDGVVLSDNWAEAAGRIEMENHRNRPEMQSALKGKPAFVQRFSTTVQQDMLYYALPIMDKGEVRFVLRLSFSLNRHFEQVRLVRTTLTLTALLAILLSLPAAVILSRLITNPVNKLRAGAKRIAEGDLAHPIEPGLGIHEFDQLAHDFNHMQEQLNLMIVNLRQEHERIEKLLSRMVEGVLAIDRNGKAIFANPAFSEMIRVPMEKIQGRTFLEISRNNQLSEYISDLLSLPKESQPLPAREIRFYSAHGEKIFSVQASTIYNAEILSVVLLVFHDITKIKMLEQIRKDFVANVSHELRTPLTALHGSTEILLDGAYKDEEQCRKFLQIMDKQLQSMHNLVSDMLRLAAMEDATIPVRKEEVEVRDLVEELVSMMEPLAQKKQHKVDVSLPSAPVHLYIDRAQISDALINLIDNAFKYTPDKGHITIKVLKNGTSVVFEVSDSGPGIPPDQIPRLFERFYRVDKSRSREMGGTGLGLAIAKHTVEKHGGKITVHSRTDVGTTFTMTLPLTK